MKSGHASEVNSAGTSFSAFAITGAAAILIGISNSEKGSSGSVCRSSLEEATFLEDEQDRKKIRNDKYTRCFNGFVFILKTNIIFHLGWGKFLFAVVPGTIMRAEENRELSFNSAIFCN